MFYIDSYNDYVKKFGKEIKHLDVFYFSLFSDRGQWDSYPCSTISLLISLFTDLYPGFMIIYISNSDLLNKTYTNNWLEIKSSNTTASYCHFSSFLLTQ